MKDIISIESKENGVVDVDALSKLYCEVYSGDPWYQNFDQDNVCKNLKILSEDPTVYMKMSCDENGKPFAFCIAKLDSPENIIDSYLETYKGVVMMETFGIPAISEDNLSEQVKSLKSVLENNPSIINTEKILYMMDIGVRPDMQGGLSAPKQIFKMLTTLFEYAEKNNCKLGLAQTLSKGPMMSIVTKRIAHTILDRFPDDSDPNHVTFTYVPDPSVFKSSLNKNG